MDQRLEFPDGYQSAPYHEDWNYLMGVVGKIKKDKHNPNEMFMGTTLERHIAYSSVVELPIVTPLDTVHRRCVEFIKWYNEKLKHKHL